MTDYTFNVNLLWSNGSGGLDVGQTGTLTLDDGAAPTVTGVLALTGESQVSIPFSGSFATQGVAAPVFTATGLSGRWSAEFSLSYGSDQIVYDGTYLGGLINLLDPGQEEWLYYIVQGMSPQGPSPRAAGSADDGEGAEATGGEAEAK